MCERESVTICFKLCLMFKSATFSWIHWVTVWYSDMLHVARSCAFPYQCDTLRNECMCSFRPQPEIKTTDEVTLGSHSVVTHSLNFAWNSKQKNISSTCLKSSSQILRENQGAHSRYKLHKKWNACHRETILKIRYGNKLNGLSAVGRLLRPVCFSGALLQEMEGLR